METSRCEVAYETRQKLWQVRDLVARATHRLSDAAVKPGPGSMAYRVRARRISRIEALALRLDRWIMEQIRKEAS